MKLIVVLLVLFALSCIEGHYDKGGKDGGDKKGSGGDGKGGYSGGGKGGKDNGDGKGGYGGGKGGKDNGDGKGGNGGGKGGKDNGDGKGGYGGKGGKDHGDGKGGYNGGKDNGDGKGGYGGKDHGDGKGGYGGKGKGHGDGKDGGYNGGHGDYGDHEGGKYGHGHGHHGDKGDHEGGKYGHKHGHHGDHDDKYKHKDHDFGRWCDEHDQPPEPTTTGIDTGSISPLEPTTPPNPCAKKRCNVGQHCIVDSTGTAQCVAPCYYEGLTYDHGMTFPAGDTCNNNCTCDNGAVTCTEEICTDCVYYFAADEEKEFPATYSSGETWVDECNTCSCDNTVYMCEQKVCGGPCTDEDGNTHEHDSEWVSSDGCNTCECTDGEIDCTEEECIVCWYNNIPHQPGEGWQDGCISCSCDENGATKCTDTCVCKSNDDCEEGYFCDIPSCEDTTGACYECTEENSCLSVPVCGCDGKNYKHSLEATDNHVIVRSYGQCPECSPDCGYGEVCCEGCFGAHNCVKLLAGQPCPDLNCGYGYGY